MPTVSLPENLLNAGLRHVSDGGCLDCGRDCSVYNDAPLDPNDERSGEVVVVHSGAMCRGFRDRFTPSEKRPKVSPACDQTGQLVVREDRKSPDAKRPHRLDSPKTAETK